MKKIIATIAIISIIAASASAAVSYTPLTPRKLECLIFEIELTQLRAVEAVDEKGSKYVHVDFIKRKTTEIFYYTQTAGKRFWQSWHGRVNQNGKSLNGSGESRQAVMVMNPREGSVDGYIVFVLDLPRIDEFTPSIQCNLSGTFEGEWDENEQRYVLKEGRGVVGGHSTATKWAAWDYLQQAVPSIQSSMAPAWGSFTVRRAVLTENEIVNLLK